jgi:outer membrane biosynthesis protein TonB
MNAITQKNQKNHEKQARIVSLALHVVMILILLFGVARSCDMETPPPTQEGILIAFGEIDAGGGQPDEGQPDEAPEQTVEETVEETVQEVEEVEVTEPAPAEEVTPTPVPDPKPDVKTTDADEIALKKKQEEAKKKKQEADKKKRAAEAKKQAEDAKKAAAAAKKKAAAEAKAKAAAEAKAKADALQAKKDKIGGAFGDKPGQGDGSNSGNAGDPNATNAGSGTGTGQVGGGLSNTGVKSKPKPPTNPGVEGNAVIKICVDPKGNVVTAEFTQGGSSITNGTAIKQAIANAKKWKFDANQMRADKVCGTITYKFDVK